MTEEQPVGDWGITTSIIIEYKEKNILSLTI